MNDELRPSFININQPPADSNQWSMTQWWNPIRRIWPYCPPKRHNLLYLAQEIGTWPGGEANAFLRRLNDASVPTRYPDELKKVMADYPREAVQKTLQQARETLTWIKTQR